MDFINRLREKSPRVQKQIALGTSAVITLAIFGLWMTVMHFGVDSKNNEITASVSSAAETSENDVNPFSAFMSVISKGWEGLVASVGQVDMGAQSATSSSEAQAQSAVSAQSETPARPVSDDEKDVFILTE